jgi:hypothetical protein
MKKLSIMLIVLMMIGIGFLSGCDEQNNGSASMTIQSTSFYAQPGTPDEGCFCVLLLLYNVPSSWKVNSMSCEVYGIINGTKYNAGEGSWEALGQGYAGDFGGEGFPSHETKSTGNMYLASTTKIIAYYRIKGTINGSTDQFFWDLSPELEEAINEQTAIEWMVRGSILFSDKENLPVDAPINDLTSQQNWM